MSKLFQLDKEATAEFDEWQSQSARSNTASKAAKRSKDAFTKAFGDRDRAQLADGRIVARVREQKAGYKVPGFVMTRFVLEA
jgi:hypothetical protein